MYWGTCYGTYCRLGKLSAPESNFLAPRLDKLHDLSAQLVSLYHVEEAKKKSFEGTWSDQARLAQRMPGYEWTKTFKALVCCDIFFSALFSAQSVNIVNHIILGAVRKRSTVSLSPLCPSSLSARK